MQCEYCHRQGIAVSDLRFVRDGTVPGTTIQRRRAQCQPCMMAGYQRPFEELTEDEKAARRAARAAA